MAGGTHPTWQYGDTGSGQEPPKRRRSPSRGFYIGMAAVGLFALFLALAGLIAAQSSGGEQPPDTAPLPAETPIPIELTVVPPQVTPQPEFTDALAPSSTAMSTIQSPRTAASSWVAAPIPEPPQAVQTWSASDRSPDTIISAASADPYPADAFVRALLRGLLVA